MADFVDGPDEGAAGMQRKLDAQVLADGNFFPDNVEIQNFGASGSGFQALSMTTPAMELIKKEDPNDEQFEWILQGWSMAIRAMIGPKPSIIDQGLNVAVYAWELQVGAYARMSQAKVGRLMEEATGKAQGRAAIQARHKRQIQRIKEEADCGGVKNTRQKRVELSELFEKGATGNRNRRLHAAKKKVAKRRTVLG